MNIGHWLHRQAQVGGDRPALFLGSEQVATYAGFHNSAARLAGWLLAQGVSPGDRVALFMKNCPDYLITLFAIWYAGAAAVPINAKLHGREAAFVIDNAEAGLAFTSPGLTEGLGEAGTKARLIDVTSPIFAEALKVDPLPQPAIRAPDDLAWLFYTSGTTGKPKGVMITHRMLIGVSLAYFTDVDTASKDDSILYAAPMSHGAGLYAMLHVLVGARHVCPVSGGFDEREIFELARLFDRVQMFAAPTMVKRMTDVARATGESGRGLRTVVYAGGPMYVADITAAVEHFGPIFVQIYGQGECPMGITALPRHDVADRSHPRWRERLASVGRAQSTVEVRVGDAQGNPLPLGDVGEIMVRGDVVMPGYWQNDEANAKTLLDGWLMTGDMGFMDADGYVTLQDRSKDLIITGGSNVYPREVEEVLLTHPKVQEVSVVGRPHPDWGEEVVAFVVGEADAGELDELCIDSIARFKRPKDYICLTELPKNNYGKVLKTELRRRLSG
ncbi:class I adenylate-forming enzyme family protein [Falsiruegeria mediterranea]|uniref:Long-chain-fatty-acid--CoA ligase n=1 Tax=Falsiruegeria mediterranea M17 TaxID=1200281 RepID=A0A2R8C7T0_9RHOB|nr:AMP-binding protein [Falsiruegeria mediterranea]SPJ28462.1 Long-chain-fatty-acid--CoA ligase [Falsiruegeria mediterranea M17]